MTHWEWLLGFAASLELAGGYDAPLGVIDQVEQAFIGCEPGSRPLALPEVPFIDLMDAFCDHYDVVAELPPPTSPFPSSCSDGL